MIMIMKTSIETNTHELWLGTKSNKFAILKGWLFKVLFFCFYKTWYF